MSGSSRTAIADGRRAPPWRRPLEQETSVSTLVERGNADRTTIGQLLLGGVAGCVRLAILWIEFRSARRLLQSMPDGALSDIGVSRGSIDHVAAFGRGERNASMAFTRR